MRIITNTPERIVRVWRDEGVDWVRVEVLTKRDDGQWHVKVTGYLVEELDRIWGWLHALGQTARGGTACD